MRKGKNKGNSLGAASFRCAAAVLVSEDPAARATSAVQKMCDSYSLQFASERSVVFSKPLEFFSRDFVLNEDLAGGELALKLFMLRGKSIKRIDAYFLLELLVSRLYFPQSLQTGLERAHLLRRFLQIFLFRGEDFHFVLQFSLFLLQLFHIHLVVSRSTDSNGVLRHFLLFALLQKLDFLEISFILGRIQLQFHLLRT